MVKYPRLSAIVARARNGIIGRDGGLPWHLSSDLKYFKAVTMGKPVLMGRVTWEGLPFPLPGRPNLVVTRNRNYISPDAEVFNSFGEMVGRGYEIAGEQDLEEVMIIGGAKIYERVLPFCDRLYVTDVNADLKGDAKFPMIVENEWKEVSSESVPAGPRDDYSFIFRVLDRIR